MKKLYGDKLTLLLIDTDSFLFHVECETIFDDMEAHLDLYDTSDFPRDHPLHSDANKKVLGKMKSETNEKCISEFVRLGRKCMPFHVMVKKRNERRGYLRLQSART